MNMNLNSGTRLTDSLERELLACAIIEQNEYHLDKVLKGLFSKIVAFIKGPEVTIHQTSTHAAN